jgi:hypothetical protein
MWIEYKIVDGVVSTRRETLSSKASRGWGAS